MSDQDQHLLEHSLSRIRQYANDHSFSAKQIELIFSAGVAACGVLSDTPDILPIIPKWD